MSIAARRERRRKRNESRRAFTRAKAERIIARATDLAVLNEDRLKTHKNSHVKRKLERKVKQLESATSYGAETSV